MNDAEKNAGIVRRAYHAFNEADIDTLSRCFDEHACWHTPGRSPIAGDAIGREAVFAQFGRYGGDTNGTFRADLNELLWNSSGRVVGIHRNTAERKGRRLDTGCCIVFELSEGRIVDGREHFFDLHNWDEFWS